MLEIRSPHQQWEDVREIFVYDLSTRGFICHLKVQQGKNEEFPLAISPDGSMVAFVDNGKLEMFEIERAASGDSGHSGH